MLKIVEYKETKTEVNDPRILPCPLCGGKAFMCFNPKSKYEANMTYYIECENQDCYSGSYTSEEKVISIWNNRVVGLDKKP